MKRIAVLLALFAAALPLFAATEANPSQHQKELARELLTLMKVDASSQAMLDKFIKQMSAQIESQLRTSGAEEDEIAQEMKHLDRLRELMHEKVDFRTLVTDTYIPLYAKYFTEQELQDLVVFYKSKSGQKSIEIIPAVTEEAMRSSAAYVEKIMPGILQQIAEEREKREPWKRTMSDMRSIATAAEAYATDENRYPVAADMDALEKVLSPTYIRKLPKKDVWGNEYAWVVSPDGQTYRLASAGSDGIFDWDSRRVADKAKDADSDVPLKVLEPLTTDILFENGVFIQLPKAASPKESHKKTAP